MKARKKAARATGKVRFKDLDSKKNPRGGAVDSFLKIDAVPGSSTPSGTPTISGNSALKYQSPIVIGPG